MRKNLAGGGDVLFLNWQKKLRGKPRPGLPSHLGELLSSIGRRSGGGNHALPPWSSMIPSHLDFVYVDIIPLEVKQKPDR